MNLSEISIRNNVFAWMLMIGLIVFGWIGFTQMGVSQMPDVDFPVVSISASLDGASPEIIESDVVDLIEEALTAVEGVRGISSNSRTGSANISVEFGLDKNIDTAVQEIQTVLSRITRTLPSDMDPPSVRKSNPEDQPIMWVAVTADKLSRIELMTLVRDQIKDRFSTVEGVGEIILGGYVEPNLRVWLSQEKLNQYQLTADDVISTINREHLEKPSGRIETSEKEMNIRTFGEAPTIKDFEEITITRRGGALNYLPIPLKNVARIEQGTEDVRSLTRSQKRVAVGLGIKKQPGSNAVQVAKQIKLKIAEVASQLPEGIQIGVRFDSTQFIEEAVGELNFTLVFSAILTALVCWLFLGSLSATINVVLAIPTSIIGCFIVLNLLGFTLNTFTLLGLSLAIGIVVDDAIMVLENIVRHKEMGKTKMQAALVGAKEIGGAALAATIAIIAIFLPVAFMDRIIGKYFLQFGITLSVAVALSLVEALTLTPMRSSRFLKVEPRTSWIGSRIEKSFEKSSEIYRNILKIIIIRPWTTIGLATLFFVATLFIGKFLKQEFIPAQDQSRLFVRIQTPPGSSLAFTDARIKELEEYFSAKSEVDSYFTSIGMMGSQVNGGIIFLNLVPPKKRIYTATQFADIIREEVKTVTKARVTVQDPSMSGFTSGRSMPVDFTIRGADWNKLVEYSEQIMKEMETAGLYKDVDTNYQAGLPEVRIIPNRVKARERGVEVAIITQTVNAMMAGVVAGKYTDNGRRYDVRVSLDSKEKTTVDVLKKLQIRNNRGELIALSELVTIEQGPSLQSISREDRQRAISIRAALAQNVSQAKAIEESQKIAARILPPGYYSVVGGSAKTFKESSSSLMMALLLGILVSYMVLASQFNSFIHPVTILIALPFSISGAFIALYLGGQTLNIYSMIGLILLMGIVKKNSIMLVEFTNQVKETGKNTSEALLHACPVRLRPILMTSIATIAGAVPPALAIGPGAESRIPMALTVIGGVFVSTLLTLFVVPCVYTLFDRVQERFAIGEK